MRALLAPIALGLVAFTIPMIIRINSLATLVVFGVVLLYALVKKQNFASFFRSPVFVLIAFHLLVLLVGLIHSPDTGQGWHDIERYMLALILPMLVYLLGKNNAHFGDAMLGFMIGCIAVTLYGFGYLLFAADEATRSQAFSNGHSFYTDVINLHPFYLSIYLTFIVFYITEKVRTNIDWRSGSKLALAIVGVAYNVALIFFLRSQIALLIFFLLAVLYLMIAFKERAAMLTFFFFSVCLIIFLLDTERVDTFFDTYGKNVSTAVDNRNKVWMSAINAFSDSPLIGTGTGGAQLKLNEEYTSINYNEGITNSFNAHNQYLEFAVRNGIVEVICFMAFVVFCFRKALNRESFLFLLFMMMICLSMIAESFLNVQKGIVFFYFFASVFIFLPRRGSRPSV